MANVLMSGLTTITTVTLFDSWENLSEVMDDLKKVACWFHQLLPENRAVKTFFYCFGGMVLIRSIPYLLRKTAFFTYCDNELIYFHRSGSHEEVIQIKKKLLGELKSDSTKLSLPKNDNGKLVILELNLGSGTNLSYYPEEAVIVGTDYMENNREVFEQNILLENGDREIHYVDTSVEALHCIPDETISCVVCFHSLCSSRNPARVLQEMKRVLRPRGKVYFIEHTREFNSFTSLWFWQINFLPSLYVLNCSIKTIERYIDQAGFQRVCYDRCHIDLSIYSRPMIALTPHIYGFAIK